MTRRGPSRTGVGFAIVASFTLSACNAKRLGPGDSNSSSQAPISDSSGSQAVSSSGGSTSGSTGGSSTSGGSTSGGTGTCVPSLSVTPSDVGSSAAIAKLRSALQTDSCTTEVKFVTSLDSSGNPLAHVFAESLTIPARVTKIVAGANVKMTLDKVELRMSGLFKDASQDSGPSAIDKIFTVARKSGTSYGYPIQGDPPTGVIFENKNQVVYPEWFGAVRSKVTDSTYNDQTNFFQEAIVSLPNGGRVESPFSSTAPSEVAPDADFSTYYYIAKSLFIMTSDLTFDLKGQYIHSGMGVNGSKSNLPRIYLVGDKQGALKIYPEEAERFAHALKNTHVVNVRFGLPVVSDAGSCATDPDSCRNRFRGPMIIWCTGCTLKNLVMKGPMFSGIETYALRDGEIKDIVKLQSGDAVVDEMTSYGIVLHLSDRVKISNCYFAEGGLSVGIYIRGGAGHLVSQCKVKNLTGDKNGNAYGFHTRGDKPWETSHEALSGTGSTYASILNSEKNGGLNYYTYPYGRIDSSDPHRPWLMPDHLRATRDSKFSDIIVENLRPSHRGFGFVITESAGITIENSRVEDTNFGILFKRSAQNGVLDPDLPMENNLVAANVKLLKMIHHAIYAEFQTKAAEGPVPYAPIGSANQIEFSLAAATHPSKCVKNDYDSAGAVTTTSKAGLVPVTWANLVGTADNHAYSCNPSTGTGSSTSGSTSGSSSGYTSSGVDDGGTTSSSGSSTSGSTSGSTTSGGTTSGSGTGSSSGYDAIF